MKKSLANLMLPCLFFFTATALQNTNFIFDNYINAIGGDKIYTVETAIVKGTVSNEFTSSTFITSFKKDYKYRTEFFHDFGVNSTYCFNGQRLSGSNELAISMIEKLNREPERFGLFNKIIFVPETEFKYAPEESINGNKYATLIYVDKRQNVEHKYFFDTKTHLLMAEKAAENFTFYKDYREFGNGILLPTKVIQTAAGIESNTEYTEIILNPELPDDIFECNPK